MKIAMIGLRGIPAFSGGIEKAVEELSIRLARKGHDVTVFCRSHYCPDRASEYQGVHLRYLPSWNTKHLEAISHTALCSARVLPGRYDIVHYHATGNSLFSFVPRIKGMRTVVTVHGLDWRRAKWGAFARGMLKIGEYTSIAFPNSTIVVSKMLRGYFRDKYGKEVRYIPNGITEPQRKPLRRLVKLGLNEEEYVLFLSRLVPEKGCHYLIEAFKSVKTDKKLVIVGGSSHSDPYVADLKKCADDPRIIFTGPLYGIEKDEAFSNAYVFVLPSEIEGLSIVLLEAMSYGNCVLASNIPENMEIVNEYGFSFHSKDVTDLRNQLEYLIANPNVVKERREPSRQFVLKNYNWDDIAARTEEVYLNLFPKSDTRKHLPRSASFRTSDIASQS